jgi:hypothetical protein
MSNANFSNLLGKVIVRIVGAVEGSESITFYCSDGSSYDMYHCKDCCETVKVKQIDGDVSDLLNAEILMAEEVSNSNNPDDDYESSTWTFYKFATLQGYVTIQWLDESNGYYSEKVYFEKIS